LAAGDSNLYCYVKNSPTNGSDPSGLIGKKIAFSPPGPALYAAVFDVTGTFLFFLNVFDHIPLTLGEHLP
jgi:hypothetical protein